MEFGGNIPSAYASGNIFLSSNYFAFRASPPTGQINSMLFAWSIMKDGRIYHPVGSNGQTGVSFGFEVPKNSSPLGKTRFEFHFPQGPDVSNTLLYIVDRMIPSPNRVVKHPPPKGVPRVSPLLDVCGSAVAYIDPNGASSVFVPIS
eukprot:CAMPEP_0184656374 /NCGR_PEP_ID=MMETSP0308-20130426/16458_1 /TAXON_ID=38269 /ORGANISM="Gloeochaete witrockiana, Strain SAG 46.84" /LENGTH=146 /DNA_ID=CAMNT_0027093477 /DNA_START=207 /DNA_END=647 /DNA_ORIENTATION=-